MEFLQKTVEFLRGVPEWVCLYLIPALVVAAAVAFVFAPKRRWYFCPAAVLVAVGFLLAYAKDSALAFIYLGLAIALVALLSLLFFIPHPAKKEGISKSRLDAMYEKFHVELSEKPYAPQESTPPRCATSIREWRPPQRAASALPMRILCSLNCLKKI